MENAGYTQRQLRILGLFAKSSDMNNEGEENKLLKSVVDLALDSAPKKTVVRQRRRRGEKK
jgi:hypothetical protein